MNKLGSKLKLGLKVHMQNTNLLFHSVFKRLNFFLFLNVIFKYQEAFFVKIF